MIYDLAPSTQISEDRTSPPPTITNHRTQPNRPFTPLSLADPTHGGWNELEDLAYDVEDILDEFATEALRHELIAEASTSKVLKLIPGCVGLNRNFVTFSARMLSKIKVIDTRLQEIVTQKNDLELKVKAQGMTKTTRSRLPSTSLVNEGQVFGRDEDKKAIINLLLSGESGDAQRSVIPILGRAGLGKTTLAQLIYNEDNVDSYFDLKAWIHVSEDFDIVRVTKVILQSITCETYDINDLNLLQVKLKDKLFGKKFLLILDDVWNENYNYWTQLRCPFEFGAPGSKIVVTTQNDRVSSTLGTAKAYKLKGLSNDACLTIFIQHALGTTDFSACPELEEIGQKISKRCKGLLGVLLSTIHNLDECKHVLNNKIWNMVEGNDDVLPTLRLSYIYLPSHLKRCFAYCSLFPKGYEFEEKELVLLWMAEGLIQETKENKPIEDLGVEYFRDLIGRSFFQQSSSNESLFVMHDLINDLAQWAAGDSCYRLEDKLGGNKQFKISAKVRHFSYIRGVCDGITKFEDFLTDVCLRTFLPLPIKNKGYLTNYVSNSLLCQLRYLRVLSLSGYEIDELPNSISDLKHLRYFNLSCTKITSLPESITSLYNLQTLILKGCSHLTKLREKIGNLVNLRHLDITDALLIKEMPMGLKELKSLQTLSDFIVGKDTESKIGDLMNLEFLRGRLCISSLENVPNAKDARNANLNCKKNLDVLVMKWQFDDLQVARVAVDVLDMLRPPSMVKELFIEGYVGEKFPTWFGDPSFSNMVLLRIENCKNCTSLPAIGQLPSLKDVVIKGMAMVRSIGPGFMGKVA
ncbi:putative disease resistance RPP13-like protein 1 [Quercus suber]|uniref:putative disease resistance RPP13-like protein 1 n=1 Tax=Quercus suber TaxID=58331 RepID=UPI0032DE3AF5